MHVLINHIDSTVPVSQTLWNSMSTIHVSQSKVLLILAYSYHWSLMPYYIWCQTLCPFWYATQVKKNKTCNLCHRMTYYVMITDMQFLTLGASSEYYTLAVQCGTDSDQIKFSAKLGLKYCKSNNRSAELQYVLLWSYLCYIIITKLSYI